MTDLKTLPDRELDAWLAEHAMGWKFATMQNSHSSLVVTQYPDGIYRNHANGTRSKWSPCADPAASKALRDRMRELGWEYAVEWGGGMFRASFFITGKTSYVWRWADTEERAVAEAAALAMGYGKENG